MTFLAADGDLGELPFIRLALSDGVERPYLLETPSATPATCPSSGGPLYDHLVHAAFVLARQGYDANWLARFADLPLAAARRITTAAATTPRE